MEYYDGAVVKTPKRLKTDQRGTKTPTSSKRSKTNKKGLINYEDGEVSTEAITPRIRALQSASASPTALDNSSATLDSSDNEDDSEEIDDGDYEDDERDEDYMQVTKKKTTPAARKKRVAKRRLKDQWTATQEFDDDVSTQDYIETTSWFKDKEVMSEHGVKIFYFCGMASGKSCPAKAYSLLPLPAAPDAKIVLYVNEKVHNHQSGRRGLPEVVKREVRRILDENKDEDINDILAKLQERNLPVPKKPQLRTFVNKETKTPRIKLPNLPQRKNVDRAGSSDAVSVGKKRKRRSMSVHRNSSPEQ